MGIYVTVWQFPVDFIALYFVHDVDTCVRVTGYYWHRSVMMETPIILSEKLQKKT